MSFHVSLYITKVMLAHTGGANGTDDTATAVPLSVPLLPRDAMLARYMLSCVRPSVCLYLSHKPTVTVTKRLNVESRKQRRTIAHGTYDSGAKNLGEIPTVHPIRGCQIEMG